MAAHACRTSLWKAFQIWKGVQRIEMPYSCIGIQQVRHKGEGRTKAPPVHAEKAKWTRTKVVTEVEKVMPKNYEEKFLTRKPVDDIWVRMHYPRPTYTFDQSIHMHRELLHPDMLNAPDALVHMDMRLDMRTKKKTKFLSAVKKTVVLPHHFDDGTTSRVVAVCKTSDDKEKSLEMGAVFAGGMEIIKAFEKGEIRSDDYDHIICTLDMLQEITTIRKYLRDDFPNKAKGNIGLNVEDMMLHFTRGRTYNITKLNNEIGAVQFVIGKLDMPLNQLEENYLTYVSSLSSLRTPTLGPFITKGVVSCPPSSEKFHLSSQQLLPSDQRLVTVEIEDQEEDAPAVAESDDEEEQVQAKGKQ